MPKRVSDNNNTNVNKKSKGPERPKLFQQLKAKFEKVNIFYAFCDAKLTTSITFQTIQKSVPDLTIEDLVAVNVIIPNFVHFHFIDAHLLEIEFGTTQNKNRSARETESDWWSKRTSATPAIKPGAIQKIIEQQNKLFENSMHAFLIQCQQEGIDPKDHLLKEIEKNTPIHLPSDDEWFQEEEEAESIGRVIDRLRSEPFYAGQLDHLENQILLPSKPPMYGEVEDLPKEIVCALEKKGISNLYIHQANAIKGIREGKHVIVSTSTASGKSLIYQIPVLESLLRDPSSKALYIFPTKALAQDQKRAFQEMIQLMPTLKHTLVSTFDGDTPTDQRTFTRDHASVIFTNPDMLHHAILTNHRRWQSFLSKLKYIVVDELHIYSGLFGLHTAYILRRLRRLCDHDGNRDYQFIACSATIANPEKHMRTLFGIENIQWIDQDGAPHGQKHFILWNPSLITPQERRGAVAEGAALLEYFLERKVRTIAFCKVRKTCELLMKHIRESLERKQKREVLQKVMSYRGGYRPEERRRIEKRLFDGDLLVVIATNALELGVDIGSLDAVLMIGVPWSTSAMWQQSGRAGRRNTDSLSLVVADKHPLDQYYANHPLELFTKTPDELSLELENQLVLESHLQCAAEELMIDLSRDMLYFGSNITEICEQHLTKMGEGVSGLHDLLPLFKANQFYRPDPRFRPYPSQYVNIRHANQDTFAVIDVTDNKNTVMEEIEVSRAGFEIYEGAIFIHQGRTYLVEECHIDKRYAKVHLVRVNWTTTQRDYTDVDAIKTDASKQIMETKNLVCYGQVRVSTTVFGYYRIDQRNRIMDSHEVYMDPIITFSNGIWADVPSAAVRQLKELEIDPMAAVHAACEYSLLHITPTQICVFQFNPSKDRVQKSTCDKTKTNEIIRI
ncbi:hypothetical protein G6F62_002886 [Rhizopus arrhizus]|nr:hypothetical protein G6F62_002886 [Rhizopus arrhizus]